MARVVVVGGGFAGMATAARLAKLGHTVTLCERSPALGGALGRVEEQGFAWDAGPWSTTLPAVLRDLFRKSGRPLERMLDLVPVEPARVHRFEDGTELALPAGSRADQIDAMAPVFGEAAALQWAEFLDQLAPAWDLLRRTALEQPFAGCSALTREQQRLLDPRRSLHKVARKTFRDERLRTLLQHHVVMQGSEPRDVPGFLAVESYVERTFGRWRPVGGMHALTTALAVRLQERGVDVRLETEVGGIVCKDDAVAAVTLADGTAVGTDLVVGGIDPRRLFRMLEYAPAARTPLRDADRTIPAVPPGATHLGLTATAAVPMLDSELVLHEESSTLVVRPDDQAPPGHLAWTVLRRGNVGENTLDALARRGIDVREQVVARVDRSPAEMVRLADGSPYGVRWAGPRTISWRPNNQTPVRGLYCAGASAHPGAGVPLVGLGAALVAELVGKA
ncbi:MAG TPA: FAD-dependent oxidoreductase [Nocardioidaceae bacterium]|nr:FAD-dependent oxidoreductase [Nocardioidaceae bacterium]